MWPCSSGPTTSSGRRWDFSEPSWGSDNPPDALHEPFRLLPDPDRAARTGLMDSSPITYVYLATMEDRAHSVRATASAGSVPLSRGRCCRFGAWVLAHGPPCGVTAGSVQRLLRLDRPSSLGGIANRLTRSNRRGTDPYARWCGRGGAARLPPIPINLLFLRRPAAITLPVAQSLSV